VEVKGVDVTRHWFERGGFNRPTFTPVEE